MPLCLCATAPLRHCAIMPLRLCAFLLALRRIFEKENMETVVSGIRSTGNLHLGNYFGAIRNFLKMQKENNCYFFIADYHSLTTHPTPADLHGNVKQVLVEYLACGLDPEKSTLYLQSDLPETAEPGSSYQVPTTVKK